MADESGHPLTVISKAEIQKAQGGRGVYGEVRHFSFFQELAEPLQNVIATAYASRGKLVSDMKSYAYVTSNAIVSMPGRASKVVHNPKIHAVLLEEEDPEALAAVVCGTGAAMCLGSVGAVVGSSLGGITGLVVGSVPALFTFGLSLPAGLIMGSTGGVCTGIAVGSFVGFAGGAISGGTVAYYRVEIQSFSGRVVAKVDYAYDKLIYQPKMKVKSTTKSICDQTSKSASYVQECAKTLVSSRHAQVTTASAAVGGIALGTAGATGGALAGGAAGAAIGLVPALFTFGLSIPIGAVIGGGMGLCVGGATGATTGLAGGAAAGYTGYAIREKPGQAYACLKDKWNATQGKSLRARSESGGTGSKDEDGSSDGVAM
jgi:hypothetical protein